MLMQKLDAMTDLTEEERSLIYTLVVLDLQSQFLVVDLVPEEILDACIAKQLKVHKEVKELKVHHTKISNEEEVMNETN